MRRLRLSFPPETATAILSHGLSRLYFEMVLLTLSTIDLLKHLAQSLSPEYLLKYTTLSEPQNVHDPVEASKLAPVLRAKTCSKHVC